ncbi:MAG: hypothetical protein WBQ69_13110 [Gallionella sp.]
MFDGKPGEVGIQQHDEVTLRRSDTGCHREAFTSIHRVSDQFYRCEALDDFGGIVGLAIVHYCDRAE